MKNWMPEAKKVAEMGGIVVWKDRQGLFHFEKPRADRGLDLEEMWTVKSLLDLLFTGKLGCTTGIFGGGANGSSKKMRSEEPVSDLRELHDGAQAPVEPRSGGGPEDAP